MDVAGSEDISIRFTMSYTCTTGERSGVGILPRAIVHHEEHVASQQLYVDMRHPAKKAHHLPVKEMAVATD